MRRYTGPLPGRRVKTGCQVGGERCAPTVALVLLRRELGDGTIVRRLCPAHATQAELSPRFVGYAPEAAA